MKHACTRALLAAALALVAACDSPSGSSGSGPLRVSVTGGDDQQDTVAQTLPRQIFVSVTDAKGKPAVNQAVTWTVLTANGGQAATATSTTNASGQAFTNWTLGTRAGAHEMQVSAGAGTVMDTVRATALPGPATGAAVANNDTVFTLDPGQTRQVHLVGVDQYDNAVAASAIPATWASRDTGSAAVAPGAGTATVTGKAGGRTVVDVVAAGDSLRLRVTVRGLAQAVVALNAEVTTMHGGGNRMLASGFNEEGRWLWERTAGSWSTVAGVDPTYHWVRVLPSGEGWMIGWAGGGPYGVYRSPVARAAWTQVTVPVSAELLTTGGNAVFLAREGGSVVERAFRLEGSTWTPISIPAAGDTAVQIYRMASAGPNDLVVGGSTTIGGVGRAYLARWNGTTTTRIPLPAHIASRTHTSIAFMAAVSSGAVYVVVQAAVNPGESRLLLVNGTLASALPPNPLDQANLPIYAVAAAPDGALWIGGEDRIARYAGGQWQSWTVRDYWIIFGGGMHVDAAGHVWAGALQYGITEMPGTLRFELIQ